jgi:Xaa-Pro aminopeptidase
VSTNNRQTDEYSPRRQTVAGGLAGRKLDALLVSFSPNLRYLSGFTGSNGSLLVLAGRAILFTDPRYQIQAGEEVTCQVKVAKGPLYEAVAAEIARLRRVGYEPARMTCDWLDALRG